MISLILILLASLFFMGIVVRTKSIASGRKGPGLLQPLKDVLRLLKKGSVYSKTTSFIFKMAPTAYLASVLMAILMIPHGTTPGIISFENDFVMFAYILSFGKFLTIIAALDTGSSFEGMGASREALYSMLVEPAFFILMGSFALFTGHTSFQSIFSLLHFGSNISYMLGAMATIVFVLIAMVENSRMPFDDPKTHLELTMVHEVMILDNSGFDLGLITYTTYLKFAMYGALIANLFIGQLPLLYSIPLFFVAEFLFAVAVGLMESFRARFRMGHNPQYIFILSSVAMLLFFGILLLTGKFL
ncbi:MAG: NADH-quinone oxidoreductase subunit H [Bacteroidales bacterium]|nr:NADH-quinone oxidoreductase subunit H [Bacteroidales bacterium]MDD3907618.1 NADH-quinone oxidoreductase subunit H [Bacteroidales bacterium]MDD4712801.1 NADH-quinone oxidoreductase subunit H [Bacteroidales bacterium]